MLKKVNMMEKFSITEIVEYLKGWGTSGKQLSEDLSNAISMIDDDQDGIKPLTERLSKGKKRGPKIAKKIILHPKGFDIYYGDIKTVSVNPMHVTKVTSHSYGTLITMDASLCGQDVRHYVIGQQVEGIKLLVEQSVRNSAIQAGKNLKRMLS